HVESMTLDWDAVVHGGMAHIGKFKGLRNLVFVSRPRGTKSQDPTDADLAFLSSLTKLQSLDMSTGMSDARMAILAPLIHLRALRLAGGEATEVGISHLAGMKELQLLDL